MLCMARFLTLRLSICECVRYQNISKNIEPSNFMLFGGSLPSDSGRKPIDFEKIALGIRVYVWGVWGGGGRA